MIVKAQTFKRGGRYPTATARAAYLQRDGREVGMAAFNIVDEGSWAAEMDCTTGRYSLWGDVVAREYVLSPAPGDNATPAQLIDFAAEWLSANFPGHEAAAVVHDDSRERTAKGLAPIAHCHVYVNAVDLDTGKKMRITNAAARELHDSAQEMAARRGWSTQESYYDSEAEEVRHLESRRGEYERRPQWQREPGRANPEYESSPARASVSRLEFEAAAMGEPAEKTRVRMALRDSLEAVSSGESNDMKAELGKRGVVVAGAKGGELKYRLASGTRWFRGPALGPRFARGALRLSIGSARAVAYAAKRAADMQMDE